MSSAPVEEKPAVLTVREAGTFLRMGRDAAYAACRRGDIPTIRIGRRVLVPRAGLEKLLTEGSQPQATAPTLQVVGGKG
jgi:excisionase family DNA binding protein